MSGSILGSHVLRTEDARLVAGGGRYLDDVEVPDCAFVTYVRSSQAHALISRIEVSAAEAMPGVIGVVTAGDLTDFAPLLPDSMANQRMVQPWLAVDRVRYVGEPIAAIVHEERYQGEDAADALIIEYDGLPAVVDPKASLAGEVLLFPDLGTNVAFTVDANADDDALDGCEVVVRQSSIVPRLAPCPLEVRGAVASWSGDLLHFSSSTQTPHRVRDDLCKVFGLPAEQVIVTTPDVGGGFGAKIGDYPDELFIAWLARRFGRTLKWVESRSESMVAMGHGRAQLQYLEIGGTRDGVIEAYRLTAIQDAGAYPRIGATLPYWTRTVVPGPYDIGRVGFSCKSVLTNTTPVVAYRGAGRPEATAAVERAIDLFAAAVHMDPIEVRRVNLIAADQFPYENAMGSIYDSGDYRRALDLAAATVEYGDLRAEQRRRRDAGSEHQMGIGISTYVEITNGTTESEFGVAEMDQDGVLTVYSGTSPSGQGHDTTWAMLASEQTGIDYGEVQVVHGDTDRVARGVGTYGSRSLQTGGIAIRAASIDLVRIAREHLAEMIEANPADIQFDARDGVFGVRGVPAQRTTWRDIAIDMHRQGLRLRAEADVQAPAASFPFGAHIVVVDVDMLTGKVTLMRVVAVDDAGLIINPVVAEGQVHGGLAQGLAAGLLEAVVFDVSGNPQTTTFADYPFITAVELPPYECLRTETPTPANVLGAKGIGEAGTIGSTPAVQNAVIDALSHLGITHLNIPMTSMTVWTAIQNSRKAQAVS